MAETKRLSPWEEACGRLLGIAEDYPYMLLDFGKFKVILGSAEANLMKTQLNEELIGKQISVLRTDLPDKPILVREHIDHDVA
jgi:hypothetical protein